MGLIIAEVGACRTQYVRSIILWASAWQQEGFVSLKMGEDGRSRHLWSKNGWNRILWALRW